MSSEKPGIGFIGLGVMGAPMASHLAAAGHPLYLHDVEPDKAARLAASRPGMQALSHPRAVAEHAQLVITMLPSGRYVQEVALGADGLVQGWDGGALLLDCSSSEPWLTRETAAQLAQRDISMVDAPVSGARAGAEQARLVFMAGGAAADLERVRPLLEIMGKEVFHLGPVGAGHTMKCINNLITSATFLATAEGLALGRHHGLDPQVMTDVLNVSTGMSWISQTHIRQRITSRKFDDPFKLGLMVKDIGIAMRLAADGGLPLRLVQRNRECWDEALAQAEPDASVSEIVRWLERAIGIEISPPG